MAPRKLDSSLLNCNTEVHRFFDCPKYDECLMFACKRNWRSFTCLNCRRYIKPEDHKPIDPDNSNLNYDDMDRLPTHCSIGRISNAIHF